MTSFSLANRLGKEIEAVRRFLGDELVVAIFYHLDLQQNFVKLVLPVIIEKLISSWHGDQSLAALVNWTVSRAKRHKLGTSSAVE